MNINKYDPSVESQQNRQQTTQEPQEAVIIEDTTQEKSSKNSNRKWWIMLIIIAIVGLFAVTCPDKQRHREAISSEVSTAITHSLMSHLGSFGTSNKVAVLGNMFVSKLVDYAIDSNMDVQNFLVLSIAKTEIDGKSRVMSVGALNNVWVLFDSNDLKEVVEAQGAKLWDSFVGLIPQALDGLFGSETPPAVRKPKPGNDLWNDQDDPNNDNPSNVPDTAGDKNKPSKAEDILNQAVEVSACPQRHAEAVGILKPDNHSNKRRTENDGKKNNSCSWNDVRGLCCQRGAAHVAGGRSGKGCGEPRRPYRLGGV